METYQLIRRGQGHKDFCEDFILIHPVNERFRIFAVFDGCSTGIDSHFASALIAKTIKAEVSFVDLTSADSAAKLLDTLVFQSSQSLKEFRNALMLETDELLSTMIIFIVDELTNSGEILAFGDGFVSINGKEHWIDQDNKPEYLAYYLDQINTYGDYEKCLKDFALRIKVESIENVCISTDGIATFKSVVIHDDVVIPDAKDYLIHNDYLKNNPSMLSRKCNILKTKFGLVNQDDIAMIRIVNCRGLNLEMGIE